MILPFLLEEAPALGEVRKLWIPGPQGRLEAALRVARRPVATVAVAHPHPEHGGTLHNPVVFHAERALHELGLTSLRFNFRGVGSSDGTHDEGRGELEDLAAAASWIRGLAPDVPLILAGYSFGSWCAVRLAERDFSIAAVIAIGLPVRVYALDELARLDRPLGVVQAEQDEFGSPDEVRSLLGRARPRGELEVVPQTTHLFPKRARAVGERVREIARRMLARIGDPW
jgi:alpha/beta superfamily hydrolase